MDPEGSDLRGMLYGGETLAAEEAVGAGRVAVTSHRVLALVPGGEPRFRAVARPNVEGVGVRSSGRARDGARALRAGVYGVALLGAGWAVDLGGLIEPVSTPAGVGLGGMLATLNALIGALGLVDDLLALGGAGAVLVALGFALRYLRSRERYLAVEVAGGEPIRVPAGSGATGAAERLEAALRKASNASPA